MNFIKFLILAIIIALITQCTSIKYDKSIAFRTSYDSIQLKQRYDECLGEINIDSSSERMKEYYRNECMKESRKIVDKTHKSVVYIKKGEVTKIIPCEEAKSKSDKKLCSFSKNKVSILKLSSDSIHISIKKQIYENKR